MLHNRVMHRKILFAAIIVIVALGVAAYLSFFRTERPSPTPSTPPDLPGAEEFGLTKAELVRQVEAVEQTIASCMNTAGFQYVPVDYLTVRKSMDADKKAGGLTDEEFRSQFGYGITTQPVTPGAPPQLSAPDSAATIGLGSENVRLFNSLSAADQAAYNRALLGENTATTFAVTLEAEDFSQTGGCTRAAIEQTFKPNELGSAYTNPGDGLIAQDSRVIAATAKWSACMREAGFNYNNPEGIEADFKERLTAVTAGTDPNILNTEARRALTELQGEERAVAVADFECAEEFIEPAVKQVETELYGAPQN